MQAEAKRKDKRRERGEQSRRQILNAAVASIAANGLGSMTLDRVAERVGISRALVVFHFKSKSRLLEAVLEFLGRAYDEGWRQACVDSGSTAMERLLVLVDYDIRFAYEHPEYVSAWHAFWGDSRGNLLYQNLRFPRDEQYGADLEQLIAVLVAEAGLESSEVEPIVMGLGALLFGIWLESHLSFDPDDCERYRHSVRHFLAKNFPDHSIA